MMTMLKTVVMMRQEGNDKYNDDDDDDDKIGGEAPLPDRRRDPACLDSVTLVKL